MKPSKRRQTKAQRQVNGRPAVSRYRRKFTEQRIEQSPLAAALVAAGANRSKQQ